MVPLPTAQIAVRGFRENVGDTRSVVQPLLSRLENIGAVAHTSARVSSPPHTKVPNYGAGVTTTPTGPTPVPVEPANVRAPVA